MTIKVGDLITNNDPRARLKNAVVEDIVEDQNIKGRFYVVYYTRDSLGAKNGRVNRVRVDRIHTDGKARHQGWSLVPPVGPVSA